MPIARLLLVCFFAIAAPLAAAGLAASAAEDPAQETLVLAGDPGTDWEPVAVRLNRGGTIAVRLAK